MQNKLYHTMPTYRQNMSYNANIQTRYVLASQHTYMSFHSNVQTSYLMSSKYKDKLCHIPA